MRSLSVPWQPVGSRAAALPRRNLLVPVIVLNFAFWFFNALHEWVVRGLFVVVGVDWARFWGASRAFAAISPAAGYRMPEIAAFMQPLVRYSQPDVGAVRVGPAPYPPIFLKIFEVFTLPPAPIGFLLWTALNVVLAVYVVHQLASRFPAASRLHVALLLLSSFPLMMALFVGQMVVLLLVGVMKVVEDFTNGREFRAGLWSGILVLKPQYAFCLFLVYMLKRRTSAIAGFLTSAAAIMVGSLAVGGIGGVTAYVRMLLTDYPAYAGGTAIDPRGMIGWRSLVITLLPNLSTVSSLVVVGLLSLLTIGLLPLIWRGPWDPSSDRFLRQMCATLAITLLVAYHSQPHGAILLLVPCAYMLARQNPLAGVRNLLIGAVALMPVVGIISAFTVGDLSLVSLLISLGLIALVVMLLKLDDSFAGFRRPVFSTA